MLFLMKQIGELSNSVSHLLNCFTIGIITNILLFCRLFEMGFGEQLTEIIARLPETRQTLLFSATLPKVLVQFARAGLSDPVLIRLIIYIVLM